MRCECGASGFRGHMLMIRRGAVPAHLYSKSVPTNREVKK